MHPTPGGMHVRRGVRVADNLHQVLDPTLGEFNVFNA